LRLPEILAFSVLEVGSDLAHLYMPAV
jgi:hypothetical protein